MHRVAILSLFALATTQFGAATANPLLDTARTAIEKRVSIDSRTDDEPDADRQVTAKIRIIVDTDANNELDDQHAMAYALFNSDVFDVVGVTVNNTPRGDGIQGQYDEAKRIPAALLGMGESAPAEGSGPKLRRHSPGSSVRRRTTGPKLLSLLSSMRSPVETTGWS